MLMSHIPYFHRVTEYIELYTLSFRARSQHLWRASLFHSTVVPHILPNVMAYLLNFFTLFHFSLPISRKISTRENPKRYPVPSTLPPNRSVSKTPPRHSNNPRCPLDNPPWCTIVCVWFRKCWIRRARNRWNRLVFRWWGRWRRRSARLAIMSRMRKIGLGCIPIFCNV